MSLFYTASLKELAQVRNKIFVERGIPALNKNGFSRSPFSTADFGWHASIGYLYQLCRISDGGLLEVVNAAILRGDRWIQIRLNIFELAPPPKSLEQLKGLEGLYGTLPGHSRTEMRLHSDDIKGVPMFSYDFMANHHKLKCYFTKNGFLKRLEKLGDRIEKDLTNIDCFIKRWHQLHKPIVTTWEGKN